MLILFFINTINTASAAELIDCGSAEYQQPVSKTGLVSWAKREIRQLKAKAKNGVHDEKKCKKAMGFQGSAYCQDPSDQQVKSDLAGLISLCNKSKKPKGKAILDCQHFKSDATYPKILSWVNMSMYELDRMTERNLDSTCSKIIKWAGAAHCKEPDAKEPRRMMTEIGNKCKARFKEIQDKKAAAQLAQKKEREEAKKNRRITAFPQSTYKGNKSSLEKQIRQAMLADRNVTKSNEEMVKVQAMGDWQYGNYADTKVPYRKLVGTILWNDDDKDGICAYSSYKYIQTGSSGNFGPLRFKAFCINCPEGWAKCQ